MTAVDDRQLSDEELAAKKARQDALRRQYPTLQEMESRQRSLIGELAAIDQIGEPDEGDMSWQGTLILEHDDLDDIKAPLVKRAKDLERVRLAHMDPANREEPVRTPDLATRNFIGQDPFRELERVRNNLVEPREVRGRALDVVETAAKNGYLRHEHAENVTRMAQEMYGQFGALGEMGANGSRVAHHILETGSEAYLEQFQKYVKDPQREANRAALSLTLANGGYLLPFILDPTIILTNSASANPWRRISNIKQTTSNTWNGVNSAGVTAAWLGEGTAVTDGTPTVGNIVVTPSKAAAWVFGSYEVLEDTDFGQQLPRLLADAKDRLEEAAFATGLGSGNNPPQPQGVVNGATTVVTTGTTLVIALADVYATQAALPARFRNAPGTAWVANVAVINKFRQLDTAGGASFWTNLGKGQPETLLGAPIYESTTMASTLTSGNLLSIFGDFGQFIIVDRVGVSMIYEPLVKSQSTALPTGQAGWFMFWRTGSALSTVNGFRVMKGL